ncbi:uncharacterized protein LOC126234875 [Schistocerca nitens]|uniref:uncharacterized protein LOC126234875 n=1 Tax=Schistocerca nitens TaxID=7011 RepID=UPI002119A450|nr:uncharacterized protein LOC126234875 [Schistocerca nitens]
MMDSVQYKKLQNDHVSNLNGTTRFETILQVAPIPFSTLLSLLAVPLLVSVRCGSRTAYFVKFSAEFCILVLPITLTLTVLNDVLHLVIIFLILLVSLATYTHTRNCHRTDYLKYLQELWVSKISSKNVPFVTMFRAITNLVTVLCILAVDFTIFPRKFAKTEYFGYSVMDVGVGLFCISNAIVSPEVRHANNLTYNSSKYILKSVISCLPLFVLGIARFFTLTNIEYQVHVTEYGVHWNFFLTLAFVKIFSSVMLYLIGFEYVGLLSVLVSFFHQCFLNAGIQDLVLSHNNTRSSFLTANCEGLASLAGYLAIYFAGMYIGGIIRDTGRLFCDYVHLTLKLALGIVVMWESTILAEYYFGVSRRLANTGYVIWVLCVSLIFFEMFLFCSLAVHSIKMYATKMTRQLEINYVPMLYEAVNFNGLACFLFANILTGVVNLCFYTLTFSKFSSIITVILYMGTVCLNIAALYWKKIKLKFW